MCVCVCVSTFWILPVSCYHAYIHYIYCKILAPLASNWHLIFGGKETAELYDIQTNTGCVLPENPPYLMRRPSGVLFGGNTPAACYLKDCLAFSRTNKKWTNVSCIEIFLIFYKQALFRTGHGGRVVYITMFQT